MTEPKRISVYVGPTRCTPPEICPRLDVVRAGNYVLLSAEVFDQGPDVIPSLTGFMFSRDEALALSDALRRSALS